MYIGTNLILQGVEASGDNFIYTHQQNVAPIMEEVAWLRHNTDRGFTQGRTSRIVAMSFCEPRS